jgi:signal transduction histidine kinase/AraC-like DNA-binding protein/CheY-like chemotaxis protein
LRFILLFTLRKLLFVSLFLFVLNSCSIKDYQENEIVFGFSQGIWNHPYRELMNEHIKIEASFHDNLTIDLKIADSDINEQINQVETFIDKSVDAIIISPIDDVSLIPSIDRAKDNGIPVILLDRKVNSENYTLFIGADNLDIGKVAAQRIISSKEEKKYVVEFYVPDNASPSIERRVGFSQSIKKDPSIELVAEFPVSDMEAFGKFLETKEGKNVNFVYAFNDLVAYSAYQVAKLKGKSDDIKFIGIDGLNIPDGGIDLVKRGILDASILYPTGGNEAIDYALKIINGQIFPKNILLTTTLIEKSNAQIMENQFNKIFQQQSRIENQIDKINAQNELYVNQRNTLKVLIFLLGSIILLIIFLVFAFIKIQSKKELLEINNKKIKEQNNKIQEYASEIEHVNNLKTNFFTGISHEFKTPLTLILGSIEYLNSTKSDLVKKMNKEMETIYRNSSLLLKILNQLLDFRKVENRSFKARVHEFDLVNFIDTLSTDFKAEFKRRNITFEFKHNVDTSLVFLDSLLVDKVFFNLFSNALKFTPNNGNISIDLIEVEDNVIIKVKDTGIGIPENEIDNVFQPYFKGSNNNNNGSGIGLYLAKQLVELHSGTIEVASKFGTEFTIKLKKGSSHFEPHQIIKDRTEITKNILDFEEINDEHEHENSAKSNNESQDESEKYSVFVIEDNHELLQFLSSHLNVDFDLYTSDGKDDIENRVFEVIPDVIICDVNLGEKNGFELCKLFKNDIRTSHIPLILLTALSNKESYIRGMESGADLYLTKPFSYNVLRQSIKSTIYNREKLRYYFTNNTFELETKITPNIDQNFIQKLSDLIDKNIDNPDFTVEMLSEELAMSRVQLYRKVKAILGISISVYIVNYRLKKAKDLIENSSLSLSEIAYSTGFSSPSYFSTTFKNKYGFNPKDLRSNL